METNPTAGAPVHGPQALPGFGLPDDNQDALIYGPTISTCLVALIIVSLRCWVRFRIIRTPSWDDYCIIVAMFLSLVGTGLQIAEVTMGFGHHTYYIYAKHGGQKGMQLGLELGFASQIVWVYAIMCVKLSVGSFLLRWTKMTGWATFRVTIYLIMAFLWAYTFMGTGALISQCIPIVYVKNGVITGSCYAKHASAVFAQLQAVCNIITNFALNLLPIVFLFRVNLPRKSQLAIMFVIALGLFASICSTVRLKFLANYEPGDDYQAARKSSKAPDGSWDGVNLVIWVIVECNVGLIAASIPALRPLFKTFAPPKPRSRSSLRIRRTTSPYPNVLHLEERQQYRRSIYSINRSYRSANRSVSRSQNRSMTRSERFMFGNRGYEIGVGVEDRTRGDEKVDVNTLREGDAAMAYPRNMDGRVDEGSIAVHTEVTVEYEERDEEDLEAGRGCVRTHRKC